MLASGRASWTCSFIRGISRGQPPGVIEREMNTGSYRDSCFRHQLSAAISWNSGNTGVKLEVKCVEKSQPDRADMNPCDPRANDGAGADSEVELSLLSRDATSTHLTLMCRRHQFLDGSESML